MFVDSNQKKRTVQTKTAEVILDRFFEEFTKKHYSKITNKLDITEHDVKEALEEIVKLNPKPGNSLIDTTEVTHALYLIL